MAKAIKKNVVKAKAPALDLEAHVKPEVKAVNTGKVSTDGAVIVKMIDEIKTANASIKTKISIAAASCVMHAIKHGDITLGLSLITALSAADGDKKGATPWRTNALRSWFIAEGPFSVTKDAKGKDELAYDDAKAKKLAKIMAPDEARFGGTLVRNPFWLAKPEADFKPFDYDKELARINRQAADYQKGTGKAAKLTPEQKAQIKLGSYAKVVAALGEAPVAIH